jgi:hypothetical protein
VLLSSIKKGWRGDPLDERPLLARLGLHAAELVLPDYRPGGLTVGKADSGTDNAVNGNSPAGTEAFCLTAPLPRDMAALIRQIEKCAGKKLIIKNEEEA